MNIKKIEAETFSGLFGLQLLNLKSNQINNIEANGFKNSKNFRRFAAALAYPQIPRLDASFYSPLGLTPGRLGPTTRR